VELCTAAVATACCLHHQAQTAVPVLAITSLAVVLVSGQSGNVCTAVWRRGVVWCVRGFALLGQSLLLPSRQFTAGERGMHAITGDRNSQYEYREAAPRVLTRRHRVYSRRRHRVSTLLTIVLACSLQFVFTIRVEECM
jgi:hypothetical protein